MSFGIETLGAIYGPLIAFIFSVGLGIYVYFLNHEHIANKLFILFMTALGISMFFDLAQGITSDGNQAWYYAKIKYAFILFVPAIFLHLSSALSDNKYFAIKRFYKIIPYLVSVVFFIFTISTNLVISGVEFSNNVYDTQYGILNPLLMVVLIVILIIGLGILIITFRETKNKEKKLQMKYIFTGMTITAILFIIIHQLLPRFTSIDIQGSILVIMPMFIFYAYAITKYKFLKVPKLVQEKDIASKPIEYELEPGYTYIIPEREPKLGFQLFAKSLKEGMHGICITMQNPNLIRNKYGLKKTPIISITEKEYDDFSVKPDEITQINELLKPYFENPENSVIYLIDDKTITSGTQLEDHSRVLELSQNFFDAVVKSNTRFIISVSPGSISTLRRKDIIKTRTPLLEFTRLAAFVFEDICNKILQFLIRNGYIKSEAISTHLINLGRKDDFFRKLKYHKTGNPISANNKIKFTNILVAQRLSKQVLIDKIKLFISEFENIETATNLNSIAMDSISKFGLSSNEFILHPGDSYIVPEADAHKSFEVFSEFVSKDFRGLCITKSYPDKIKRKYNLMGKGMKLYWLTDISESKKDILPPKLEHILSAIEDFLLEKRKVKDQKKIIMLDGIEYLITYSGDSFDSVLGFLRQVIDRVSEKNGIILIPMDPKIISEERMGLLMRSGMEVYNS